MSGIIIDPSAPTQRGLRWHATVHVVDEATNETIAVTSWTTHSPFMALTDAHRQQLKQIGDAANRAMLRVLDHASCGVPR